MATTNQEWSDKLAADSQDPLGDLMRAAKGAFATATVFSFIVNMTILVMPFYMYSLFVRVIPSRATKPFDAGLRRGLGARHFNHCRVRENPGARKSRAMDRLASRRTHLRHVAQAVGSARCRGEHDGAVQAEFGTHVHCEPQVFLAVDAVWVPVFIAVLFALNYYIGLTALFVAGRRAWRLENVWRPMAFSPMPGGPRPRRSNWPPWRSGTPKPPRPWEYLAG